VIDLEISFRAWPNVRGRQPDVKTALLIVANGAAIVAGILASYTVNAHHLRFPPPQIVAMAAVLFGASAGASSHRRRHFHG
jgi:hypothetical protein